MASNYTEHYGLCQWEPGDNFIRSEFNGDNQKIDAAITAARAEASTAASAAQAAAERALAGLVPVSYNVYQLVLQNYYDRKQTGWKQAMVFDGFLDGSLVGGLSGALTRSNGCLALQGVGQGDVNLGYHTDVINNTGGTTAPRTATGFGDIVGFTCRLLCFGSGWTDLDYYLSVNGVRVVESRARTPELTNQIQDFTILLPNRVPIRPGDVFLISIGTNGSSYPIILAPDRKTVGGIFRIDSSAGQSGRMTTVGFPLPECRGLRAWVRYKNGGVTFAVRRNGTDTPMILDGQKSAVNLQGANCTEAAFRLDTALTAGSTSFALNAALNGAASMEVFDYGVILL